MPKKKEYNILFSDEISPATFSINESPIIPSGVMATLRNFGVSIPSNVIDGMAALEWGDTSGGWTTIRALAGTFEINMDRSFTGDGVKKFRLVRRHESANNKRIIAWADIFTEEFE